MDELGSQMAFSGAHFKRMMGADLNRTIAPDADREGDPAAYGRAIHRATDLAFHLASGIHSHSGLVLAEPYRREGVFPLERLPE